MQTFPSLDAAGPSLTIAICTYNRHDHLANTLSRLAEVDLSGACEILVVDQTQPTYVPRADDLALGAPLRVAALDTPGLGRSRNEVIARAKGEVILFIDDDVIPEPGLVQEHLRVYEQHPQAVGCAGFERIDDSAAVSRHSAALRRVVESLLGPWLRWRYGTYADAEGRFAGLITRSGLFLCDFSRPLPCRVMTPRGCNMSFRAEALRAIGGFDERIGPRDESDVSMRLQRLRPESEIWFNPQARLTHLMAATGGCRNDQNVARTRQYMRSDLLFARRNLGAIGFGLFALRTALWRLPDLLRHPSLWSTFAQAAVESPAR